MAVKHFTKYFKDGGDVNWFAGENVVTASFTGLKGELLFT